MPQFIPGTVSEKDAKLFVDEINQLFLTVTCTSNTEDTESLPVFVTHDVDHGKLGLMIFRDENTGKPAAGVQVFAKGENILFPMMQIMLRVHGPFGSKASYLNKHGKGYVVLEDDDSMYRIQLWFDSDAEWSLPSEWTEEELQQIETAIRLDSLSIPRYFYPEGYENNE